MSRLNPVDYISSRLHDNRFASESRHGHRLARYQNLQAIIGRDAPVHDNETWQFVTPSKSSG